MTVRNRTFSGMLLCLLVGMVSIMAGCSADKETSAAKLVQGKVNVVASFYPLYDLTRKIGGDYVNVINMVPAGVEPHDWAPKGRDIQTIQKADLFIYLGAGFEGWTKGTLANLPKDAKVAQLEVSNGMKLLPSAEGVVSSKHDHKDSHGHKHDDRKHEEESPWDPHVWLSPVEAKQVALVIKQKLVSLDAAHQAEYEANFTKLSGQLDALHESYKSALTPLPRKEIVVTHQSFGYLAKEYGLKQMPIMGLAPDAEPTSKDLKAIYDFVKSNGVRYIFFEELVSDRVAKTLAKDVGVGTLVLNPIEGLTEEQQKAGEDYFSIMHKNLANLVEALK